MGIRGLELTQEAEVAALQPADIVDAVAHQGVGLAATDLHEHPGTGGVAADAFGQGAGDAVVGVAAKGGFLAAYRMPLDGTGDARWTSFVQGLLVSNEFTFVD